MILKYLTIFGCLLTISSHSQANLKGEWVGPDLQLIEFKQKQLHHSYYDDQDFKIKRLDSILVLRNWYGLSGKITPQKEDLHFKLSLFSEDSLQLQAINRNAKDFVEIGFHSSQDEITFIRREKLEQRSLSFQSIFFEALGSPWGQRSFRIRIDSSGFAQAQAQKMYSHSGQDDEKSEKILHAQLSPEQMQSLLKRIKNCGLPHIPSQLPSAFDTQNIRIMSKCNDQIQKSTGNIIPIIVYPLQNYLIHLLDSLEWTEATEVIEWEIL